MASTTAAAAAAAAFESALLVFVEALTTTVRARLLAGARIMAREEVAALIFMVITV